MTPAARGLSLLAEDPDRDRTEVAVLVCAILRVPLDAFPAQEWAEVVRAQEWADTAAHDSVTVANELGVPPSAAGDEAADLLDEALRAVLAAGRRVRDERRARAS